MMYRPKVLLQNSVGECLLACLCTWGRIQGLAIRGECSTTALPPQLCLPRASTPQPLPRPPEHTGLQVQATVLDKIPSLHVNFLIFYIQIKELK